MLEFIVEQQVSLIDCKYKEWCDNVEFWTSFVRLDKTVFRALEFMKVWLFIKSQQLSEGNYLDIIVK